MAEYDPDYPLFEEQYRNAAPQVVWTRLVADLETPVSAMLRIAGSQTNTFLLESVEGGESRGRYSIIGMRPDLVWRCRGNKADVNRRARYEPDAFVEEDVGAIESLKRLVRECAIPLPETLPPMASALVGYVGYEMVRLMERLPTTAPRVLDVPDGLLIRPTIMAIFDNVAAALKGMLEYGHGLPKPGGPDRFVAMTMLGNTTASVMAAKGRLEEAGYEAVIFHSNGVGGPAMEELAAAGQFVGVIDFTTNEVYDPLVGGIHDGGPRRLTEVGRLGLPQVVVPGCIDFSVWNTGTVPTELEGRPVYDHNPEYILVRASRDEMIQLGYIFAEKLDGARAPVVVAVPTRGLSIPNVPGGPFWNPEADSAYLETLRREIRSDIPVRTFEYHVNEPAFGREVAELFLELMKSYGSKETP